MVTQDLGVPDAGVFYSPPPTAPPPLGIDFPAAVPHTSAVHAGTTGIQLVEDAKSKN